MNKVALVGCGRISKRHIEAISTVGNLDIISVCDIDEKKQPVRLMHCKSPLELIKEVM